MAPEFALFLGEFSTLLALVNPLEAVSVFLSLTRDDSAKQRRSIAVRSCLYALLLMFFFLIFGNLILRIFGVPLSMVRMAGGLILIRIGFGLFSDPESQLAAASPGATPEQPDIAFVPFAMPIMFGPGGIATIIGMTSLVTHSRTQLSSFLAVASAIVLTMATTFLFLFHAQRILKIVGARGVDAVTRIIGFFVATMGMSLLFDGAVAAVKASGLIL